MASIIGVGVPLSLKDMRGDDLYELTDILTIPLESEKEFRRPLYCHENGLRENVPQEVRQRRKYVENYTLWLSSRLKAPPFIPPFVVRMMTKSINPKPAAPLCNVHGRLNGPLIRSIFLAHIAEVGYHLNDLISCPEVLTDSCQARVARLRALHSMWIPRHIYKQWFFKEADAKWLLQENECEACMLARMGGDPLIAQDLRICAWSRWRTGHNPPRLYRYMNQLINHYQITPALDQMAAVEADALKQSRKDAAKRLKDFKFRGYEGNTRRKSIAGRQGSKKSSSRRHSYQPDVFRSGSSRRDSYQPKVSPTGSSCPASDLILRESHKLSIAQRRASRLKGLAEMHGLKKLMMETEGSRRGSIHDFRPSSPASVVPFNIDPDVYVFGLQGECDAPDETQQDEIELYYSPMTFESKPKEVPPNCFRRSGLVIDGLVHPAFRSSVDLAKARILEKQHRQACSGRNGGPPAWKGQPRYQVK